MTPEFFVGPREELDKIRLGPAVASGAEGVLYRGFLEVDSGSIEIAVKMLQPGHLHRLPEWAARWREQVELLRQVQIPGLVAVRGGFVGALPHLAGQGDASTSSLYLLMDWVEGVSLDRWVRSVEAAQPEQLLLALVPVAAALDLLHSGAATDGRPVVHRDVKPANILVRPAGDTVLVDLGSVRGLTDDLRPSGVVGTPGYIAPEVRDDGQYGAAADRYALGAVGFFLLTGAEPPINATLEELRAHLAAAPLVEGRPEIADHVLAMLDPDPTRRPTSLANWVAQLRRSSLAALPGEVALAPRAPSRHPRAGRDLPGSKMRRRRAYRWAAWTSVASLAVALGATAAWVSTRGNSDHPPKRLSAVSRSTSTTMTTLSATTLVPPRTTSTASAGGTYLATYRRVGSAVFPLRPASPFVVQEQDAGTGNDSFAIRLAASSITRSGPYDNSAAPSGSAYFNFTIHLQATVGQVTEERLTEVVIGIRPGRSAGPCNVKLSNGFCQTDPESGASFTYDPDPAARSTELTGHVIPDGHWEEQVIHMGVLPETLAPNDFVVVFKDKGEHLLSTPS